MSLSPRAIALQGIGYGALFVALQGLIPVPEVVQPPFGGGGGGVVVARSSAGDEVRRRRELEVEAKVRAYWDQVEADESARVEPQAQPVAPTAVPVPEPAHVVPVPTVLVPPPGPSVPPDAPSDAERQAKLAVARARQAAADSAAAVVALLLDADGAQVRVTVSRTAPELSQDELALIAAAVSAADPSMAG